MENLLSLLQTLKSRPLNMREKDGETFWSQTERNQIRNELINALVKDFDILFNNSEFEVARTVDGCTINVPHDDWGSFSFSLAPKMHNPDYDLYDEADFYVQKQESKNVRKNP